MNFVYKFNTERWPLVIIPSPGDTPVEKIDQESFYREADRLLVGQRPAVVLHDLSQVGSMDAARRRKFVTYAEANRERVTSMVKGYAVLIDSPVIRGIVTAVLWFLNPPCPMKIFTSRAKAIEWLKERYPEAFSSPPDTTARA
ncbi:MAG: hypothetical protein R3A47_10485 [Polyangiales bacterium]